MLNLGKFVEVPKIVREVMALPSPIGWWEITSFEGEEGYRLEEHGTFYGHLVEILFSVLYNATWKYNAKFVADKAAPAERPFYKPVRKWVNISGSIGGYDKCWEILKDINSFKRWICCDERVKVHENLLWETHALELLN